MNDCDFIYREFKRVVEKRMPNYCQYVQRLIKHIVYIDQPLHGEKVGMDLIVLQLRGGLDYVPAMMPLEGRTKAKHDPQYVSYASRSRRGSHGGGPAPKKGASKLFRYV
jgi:hypothetical protein